MPRFFAMTSRGLGDVLARELDQLGMKNVVKDHGGVGFESNWAGCYRANLRLRSATRVLLHVQDFPAYNGDDLYNNLKKHDFTKYIGPDDTLAVESKVRDSAMQDQRFVGLKVKDAIVDQFREKFDRRPNVDSIDPDLRVVVRVVKNQVSVSIDTSGKPLFKRGYRDQNTEAPLKEHVAAGLLLLSGWNQEMSVVDPMCGSGTFLIEAALMAQRMSPGTMRSSFAFQRFSSFDEKTWQDELDAALALEREVDFKFYGFDVDRKAIAIAKENAKMAGVDHLVEFHRQPFETLKKPVETGLLITNPPYGERIGYKDELIELYKNFAHLLKVEFKGWDCFVLSGDPELSAEMRLKATHKYKVFNGPIECRLLRYKMF